MLSHPAYSFEGQTEINADRLQRRGDVLELEGNVFLKRQDAVLRAGKALYNAATGEIKAEGEVSYEDRDVVITAERAEVNMVTRDGLLHGAFVLFKAEGYRIWGEEIRKTGPERFLVKKGTATTCEGIPPEWCFSGSEVDIILGERIKARSVVFRVKDIPVLYLPYLWAPLLTERQTGLLPPTLGYRDSTGVFYRQPFFWAISENRDATLDLVYFSRRAFAQGVEYRYIEGPRTAGNLSVYHLRDSLRDRHFLEWKARHRQGEERVSGFLSLNLVNYRDFYRLYEPYVEQSSKRFLESAAEVQANTGNIRLYLQSRYLKDLKDGVEQDTVLQRLPEAGIYYAPDKIGPLVVTSTARAARFERARGLDADRYDISVSAAHALGRSPALTQTLDARQIYYKLEEQAPLEESLKSREFDYEAALMSAFERYYGRTKHSLEPSLSYRSTTLHGERPPLLDSTETAREASALTLSVMNRLMGGAGEFLTLKVSQPYDFLDDLRPYKPLSLDLSLRSAVSLTVSAAYDHYDSKLNSVSSGASVRFRGSALSASYNYTRNTGVRVYGMNLRQAITRALELEAGIKYDEADEGGLEEFKSALKYMGKCWGVELTYVKRPDDFTVFLMVSLAGLGEFGVR
jgi:LPS-assembly protein